MEILSWDSEYKNDDCYFISYIEEIEIQINFFGDDKFGLIISSNDDKILYDDDVIYKKILETTRLVVIKHGYKIDEDIFNLPKMDKFIKLLIRSKK